MTGNKIQELQQKIERFKDAISSHENTIERIENGTSTFYRTDYSKAKNEAEEMIKGYLKEIKEVEAQIKKFEKSS